MKIRSLALAIAGLSLANTATAAPYAPFDVRSAGMGGTGVASAKAASASLFNPAMLSAQVEGDRFQFILGAGANVADEDELFDQLDELDPSLTTLDNDIITLRGETITPGIAYAPGSSQYNALTAASASSGTVANQLGAMNNDSMVVGFGSGLGVGVAGKQFGIGVFVGGTANAVSTTQITANDTSALSRLSTIMADGSISTIELAANTDLFSAPGGDVEANDFNPTSSANGFAVALVEYGVGMSHQFAFDSGSLLSIGATPKVMNVITYDYTESVDNFEDSEIDTQEKTESVFDVDLGVVYKSSAESPWQYGLVAKHLVGGTFTTQPNVSGGQPPKTVEVDTQVRAGVARMTKRTTLALDVDLVENDGISAGTETQFVAFGAEYDLTFLQLRAGYRSNLADSDVEDVATVGLGLGPVDISAVGGGRTAGAYLQFGFGW